MVRWVCALVAVLTLAGCGSWGSVGIGIPYTPIGVGVSAPMSKNYTYVPLQVESNPAGAEIRINGQVVGSAPLKVYVPFGRGFWGGAKGSAQLTARKGGYMVEGVPLFAVEGGIANEPGGAPIRTLTVSLRAER